MAKEIIKKAGVSGNSVAGKSFQIFTVSEELLAKVVEAVQAGEKEARSSGNIQSFEVFCHGFRANISLGRIMVVPAKVCNDRQNFPTALLHGALVRVFGTGGEEVADLIEKRIGDSEFDEYSQADFDTIKEELFTDVKTGEEASLVVFAPNWMNSREYICFHFSNNEEQLKNDLRHQVFSAYYNPSVSSAFNALMTNVDTTKVDVTDVTPKLSYPFLTENPLKQFPQLEKQAGHKKATILLNRKTADDITKQTLDPQELDVFDSLNQALENSLLPDADGAQGEGGFKAPEAHPGVPREAAAKVAHIGANGICPGCKKAGSECSCSGCTCKAASVKKIAYVAHVPGHKNSKGESAPWVIKQHNTDKILESFKSEAAAKAGLKNMESHKGSVEVAPHETPFTNVEPGTEAHAEQEASAPAMKDSATEDAGKADEMSGGPIGIAIDETGVPRSKTEESEGKSKDASKKAVQVQNPSNRKRESSHPETLRVSPDRLSSAMSATFNGGYRDVTATDGVLHPYTEKTGMGNNAEYPPHAAADHEKDIKAGRYGEDPLNRRSNEKWGSAEVPVKFKRGAVNRDSLNDFEKGYIEAALWSTNDDSTPSGGEPLDKNYDIEDISDRGMQEIRKDCAEFQQQNAQLLEEAYQRPGYGRPGEWSGEAMAGHDFWLTRCGHGVGFWDRDALKEGGLGEKLSEAARAFGNSDLYVGDDHMVHVASAKSKAFSPAYVAAKMGKIVDSDGGYEAMSVKAKKARAKKESLLDKFRPKTAVELDIDSIWDAITEDMGPAPLVDVDSDPSNPAPSNTEGESQSTPGDAKEEPRSGARPNKRDVEDLPEEFRSPEPEDEKEISDSEAESQETDLDEHGYHGASVDSKYADFVEDVAGEIENEEELPRMGCDQCEMAQINGVPCHEHGCPNMGARWDAENGMWIPQRECFECGMEVDEDDPCCSAPVMDEADEARFGSQKEASASPALEKKLHPSRFPGMSGKMTAIVGYILGKTYTNPSFTEMAITSDGIVMGQHSGDVGMNDMVGSYSDLKRNWDKLISVAGLDAKETKEAQSLFKSGIRSYMPHEGSAKKADTADNGYDIDSAAEPTSKEMEPSDTVECHQDYNTEQSEGTDRPKPEAGADIKQAGGVKRLYEDEMIQREKAEFLHNIQKGDRVTILVPAGIGRGGQEWKEATGTAVMPSALKGGWVLDMGGRHGTPGVANENNIVSVRKSKQADTADNPYNMTNDGKGAPENKKVIDVKDTTEPTPDNTKKAQNQNKGVKQMVGEKHDHGIEGDVAQAKSETTSPDVVDADISQPTVSVLDAGKRKNAEEKIALHFMNEYEIDEAVRILGSDPYLGKAARFLAAFRDEVNSHSDGWSTWRAPATAAGQLMTLIEQGMKVKRGQMFPETAPLINDKAIAKAMGPIKSFMTRRGLAAGMEMPKLAADISGDMSEAKAELSYNKAEIADEPMATQTVSVEDAGERKNSADISGDIAEADAAIDYDKSVIADDPQAESTVNPEHFADDKKACGEDQPESIEFDFGAGDLADIVLVEEVEEE